MDCLFLHVFAFAFLLFAVTTPLYHKTAPAF